MRGRLIGILTVLLLAGGLSSSGQPQVYYGPSVPTQEWGSLMKELVNGGTRATGVEHMRAFAERNRGTTPGAHAFAAAATYSENDTLYRQLMQQLVCEYPNSTFSLQAQVALFRMNSYPTTLAWMSANFSIGTGKGLVIPPTFAGELESGALKAAAWDDQYYYYIPYKPEPDKIDFPDPKTALNVHRVKLSQPIPTKWSKFPPDAAEPAEIP